MRAAGAGGFSSCGCYFVQRVSAGRRLAVRGLCQRAVGGKRLMASSSADEAVEFGDLYTEKGMPLFEAWRASRPETWTQYYCPLTSLRRTGEETSLSSEKQFRLGVEWRHQCERMRTAHPFATELIPVFVAELVEFDVRCWFLGLPPIVGLQLRQHNFERRGILWP